MLSDHLAYQIIQVVT